MTPPLRDLAPIRHEGIDWSGATVGWICEACGALRYLPPGAYWCLCCEPPTALRKGLMRSGAAAAMTRLVRQAIDRGED